MESTYEGTSTNGARWAKPAVGLAAGGGTALMLITRRRRKKNSTPVDRARERARGVTETARKELPKRADDLGDTVQRGASALVDGLKAGQWQAWAALLGGVWLLFRLGESRQLRRIRRAVAA